MKRLFTLLISIFTTLTLFAIDPAGSRVDYGGSSVSDAQFVIMMILLIFVGIPVGIMLIASRKKDDE